MIRIPAAARWFLAPLERAARAKGIVLHAVGGCVRDWILGRATKDLDLISEADPAPVALECARLLKGRAEAFGEFGTWRVLGGGFRVDFARTRREDYPEPACLPKVGPAGLREDLVRRDFTVNAMALSLDGRAELADPHGGLRDLRAGVLRVMHPGSFRDDPTRVFRLARFSCRFKMRPAPGLLGLAREALVKGWAGRLSRHRLAQELLRVLAESEPSCALARLRSWGYLDLIYPRLPAPRRWPEGVYERLGLMALASGPRGNGFLDSLSLERQAAAPLRQALAVARAGAAARLPLDPTALRLLRFAFPRLSASALKPLFVAGGDLMAMGLKPGPDFSRLLDDAARGQWRGRIRSRAQALRRLKSALKPGG